MQKNKTSCLIFKKPGSENLRKVKGFLSFSAGRVGGDPPKISFLAFGVKIGSSVGVKTHHFRVKIQIFAILGDFFFGIF